MNRTRRGGRTRRRRAAPARAPHGLSDADKRRLIATALELVEKLYVHLPLKRSMYAVNPVQRLRLLARRLDGTPPLADIDFYTELLSTFASLRDLHTSFVLPEPFRSTTAYLPFRIESCVTRGRQQYLVTHVMDEGLRTHFERGVEITHWNGIPMARAVALNADREAGSNPSARLAQGLAAMTIRWMGRSLPPDEHWVDVRFLPLRGARGAAAEERFEWRVFKQGSTPHGHGVAKAKGTARRAVGMDTRGEVERQIRHELFFGRSKGPSSRDFGRDEWMASTMPDVFPWSRNVITKYGTFAYIRIASFNVEDDGQFLREFQRLAAPLSPRGLMLDVRGNTGGLIHAGERLLQLLTARRVEPTRFHFLNSPSTARLTEIPGFKAWRQSIEQSVETGGDFSQGFPLLPPARYNDIGQKYQGPVVLITDALCYSTTDIFASGFQDHEIGPILGVDDATGAGGANVWDYWLIAEALRDPARLPAQLPMNASFQMAMRRVTRVGPNAGMPLEDLGVRPTVVHRMTRKDVLHRNVDLVNRAARILSRLPWQRLTVAPRGRSSFLVSSMHLDRVDAYIDDHPLSSSRARRSFRLHVPAHTRRDARTLRLEGFRGGELVACTRASLR